MSENATRDEVVLLHSGGMSSRQWRSLARALEADWRVTAPDLLGSGEKPAWADDVPFSIDLELAALEAALPAGQMHLVGHSYGALLALKLAQRHPDRVLSLSLYEPPAFGLLHESGDGEGLADLAGFETLPVFTDEARGGGEEWMQGFIDYWNVPGAWKLLPDQSRAGFLKVGRKVYREVRAIMADRTGRADYAKVTAPALVMSGGKSPVAERRLMKLLGAALPHATPLVFDEAGHMGPLTHSAPINQAILSRLKAHQSATQSAP